MMRRVLLGFVMIAAVGMASGEELFVPMVAQCQGLDGAWWNTEVWIANPTVDTGSYAAVFLPAGQPNLEGLRADPPPEDLPPGATVYRNDLIPEGGIGVLRFITTPGVVVFSRVFNAAGRGSFGQGIPAMPRSAATRPGEIAQLVGLRRTPAFRTNISLFNPSTESGVVHVRLYLQRGEVAGEESYRLAPGGYLQLVDALHALGVARGEHVRAEVTGTVPFFAFASVIDARSGAPTLVPAAH
ncbi:MAG: hypothetical protein B7Z61_02975 [Acidobacteria bacterium 37-71-11]|nr:MAG: hypothetical protein B7Z61_02975 [Acidobacteria bacterium 37-71-11]HQT94155.1 hypothetical protein [Thermoanaerobaculaceae bacterium]